MPARKITYNNLPLSDGRYLSKHSDKEYETLLKAFLLLGERYDKLQSDYEEALGDIDDMIEQQIIEDEHRDWQGE